MTTTRDRSTLAREARLLTIADRLREYSTEIENLAAEIEEETGESNSNPNTVTPIDFLYRAARSIDDAAGILEELRLA